MRKDKISQPLDLVPMISVEKIFSNNLSGEISVGYFYINFINGWDRWDIYSPRKGYVLANCFPISTHLKFNSNGLFYISTGPRLINPILTKDGKIALKPNYFGWELNLEF